MKRNIYITTDGTIERDENTIYLSNKNGRIPIPVENLYQIFCYASINITSQALHYFSKKGIPIHFFNYYGFYDGSFYPRERLISGDLIIKQVQHYLDYNKRLALAKAFVKGSMENMKRTIAEYKIGNKSEILNKLSTEIKNVQNITELMNVEARARIEYYDCFDHILKGEFRYKKRTRQPPQNEVNAMISFGNSLLYSTCLTELYNTQLNPAISYLHEPGERRYSLCLDICELFKPLIVDRLIFYVVNKKILTKQDFRKELNGVLFTENGKRKFLAYYEKKLHTTIKHRNLRRNVSYQRLIRLEAYKLIKHLLGIKTYKPFVLWW